MYEKQLLMPKWQYIIVYGILLWGITVLLMMIAMDLLLFNKSIDQQWREGMLIRIVMMPFAGIFFGWFMRRLTVKRLAKLREKEAI